MIFGLTAVVVVGGGAFVAKRSYDNSKIVPTPITPEDFGKIALGDLYAPDPKADAYKAAAVTAYKKDKLKNARKGVAALDWIEIKDKGPGGDGFPQANFPLAATRRRAATRAWPRPCSPRSASAPSSGAAWRSSG